jgi:hypothetical protein
MKYPGSDYNQPIIIQDPETYEPRNKTARGKTPGNAGRVSL